MAGNLIDQMNSSSYDQLFHLKRLAYLHKILQKHPKLLPFATSDE